MSPMPSPAPAAMPAHLAGLPRRLSFAFIVIALTRGLTDAAATRASFNFATLRDLRFAGMAASFSFQVRSSEVVWISMIFSSVDCTYLYCQRGATRFAGGLGQRADQPANDRVEPNDFRRVPVARQAPQRSDRSNRAHHGAADVAVADPWWCALPDPDRRHRDQRYVRRIRSRPSRDRARLRGRDVLLHHAQPFA